MINRSPIASGRRAWHRVTVQNPSPPRAVDGVPVDDPWIPGTPPDWYVAIDPATAGDQERAKSTGVLTQPSTTITGPYRADVTTASQLIDTADGTVLYVVGVEDHRGRHLELIVQCSTVAPT
jgi:head-tail adaptor